jgi:tRNA-dihydrouridine synthase
MNTRIDPYLPKDRPALILAPMQDVTDLPFWQVMHRYGGPDIYFTEYFRVHRDSHLEKHILKAIHEHGTGRPVIAQMIGEDIPSLVRTAEQLQELPIMGVDLNMGCPAPVVCKKSAGGGLLRDMPKVNEILKALRETVSTVFTVKSRIGFLEVSEFDEILNAMSQHPVDAWTIHGRTVKEMYRPGVHYDKIAQAARSVSCPVFANGNVLSAKGAKKITEETGTRGLMIGRGAIRNPWLFNQIRELYEWGEVQTKPSLRDVRGYVDVLYRMTLPPELKEQYQVAKMKKLMNFIAQGIDDTFLHEIRRAVTEKEFFETCDRHLDRDGLLPTETEYLVNSGDQRLACY